MTEKPTPPSPSQPPSEEWRYEWRGPIAPGPKTSKAVFGALSAGFTYALGSYPNVDWGFFVLCVVAAYVGVQQVPNKTTKV